MSAYSRKCTAYTKEDCKYKFLCVPFGTHVDPSYFVMMINEILKGLDFCYADLDDIIIYPKTEKECLEHTRHFSTI